MYEVYLNGELMKRYPYKAQAVMWCYMNGFVTSGSSDGGVFREYVFLDERVKIRKVK